MKKLAEMLDRAFGRNPGEVEEVDYSKVMLTAVEQHQKEIARCATILATTVAIRGDAYTRKIQLDTSEDDPECERHALVMAFTGTEEQLDALQRMTIALARELSTLSSDNPILFEDP